MDFAEGLVAVIHQEKIQELVLIGAVWAVIFLLAMAEKNIPKN